MFNSNIWVGITVAMVSYVMINYIEVINGINIIFLDMPQQNMTISTSRTSANIVQSLLEKDDWKFVGNNQKVDVYFKEIPGSKLFAFRGVTIVPMHISNILRPFSNLSLSYDWVEMLSHIESYNIDKNDDTVYVNLTEYFTAKKADIVYQYLQLPWPISPRELLLHRSWKIDNQEKSVTFRYHSIFDDRVPERMNVVRSESLHTLWRFTALTSDKDGSYHSNNHQQIGNVVSNKLVNSQKDKSIKAWNMTQFNRFLVLLYDKLLSVISKFLPFLLTYTSKPEAYSRISSTRFTKIEMECLADSKGTIPTWFLNYIQKSFPPKIIKALLRVAERELGKGYDFPGVSTW